MDTMEKIAGEVLNAVSPAMTPAVLEDMKFLLAEGEYGIVVQDALKLAVAEHVDIPTDVQTHIAKFVEKQKPIRHTPAIKSLLEKIKHPVAA